MSVAALTAFLSLYVVGWVTGFLHPGLAIFGIVVLGSGVSLGVWSWWRSRHAGWVLRLDRGGVTVRDRPCTPWTDIAQVRVSQLKPSWLFWAGRRRLPVVAFIPRPGVELPWVRSPGQPSFRWQRATSQKLYGTPLAILASVTTAGVAEILTSVRAFSDETPIDNRLEKH